MTEQNLLKWCHFQAEIILLCVRWYLRYALSYRDLEEMMVERGLHIDHTTQAGITVGLFDEYGPAQRLYTKRGYVPDGRGGCQGQRPLKQGETVTVDHDLILWLTKDL